MTVPIDRSSCVNTAEADLDETPQLQALDRTAPTLAMQPGLAERCTHDYRRNVTTTLFASLEIAAEKVSAAADRATVARSACASPRW